MPSRNNNGKGPDHRHSPLELVIRVPFSCYISGPDEGSLKLSAEYLHEGHNSSIIFLSGKDEKPLELKDTSTSERYFIQTSHIEYSISPVSIEKDDLKQFKELCVKTENRDRLFALIVPLINRVLKSIKGFGFVANIRFVDPRQEEHRKYLIYWRAEFTEDGTNYKPVEKASSWIDRLKTPASHDVFRESLQLSVATWPDIMNAIDRNEEPPEENIYITNAKELVWLKHYKMALLESIICLELAITNYLKAYLGIRKKITKKKIKYFLSANLGLTARAFIVLNIVGPKVDLQGIDVNAVLKAIRWRNKTIHEIGLGVRL